MSGRDCERADVLFKALSWDTTKPLGDNEGRCTVKGKIERRRKRFLLCLNGTLGSRTLAANFWEASKAKHMSELEADVGGKLNRRPDSIMF